MFMTAIIHPVMFITMMRTQEWRKFGVWAV
jgi:hypothetical protein